MARFSENTTSSAFSVEPSLNFTPERKLKRHCVPDTSRQEVASKGSILKVWLL